MESCAKTIMKIASQTPEIEEKVDGLEIIRRLIEFFECKDKHLLYPVLQDNIQQYLPDKKIMEKTVDMLVEKALKDWMFGGVAVNTVVTMSANFDSKNTFDARTHFLKLLQTHYTNTGWKNDEITAPFSSKKLGCLSLLTHSSYLITLTDGEYINQFVKESFECLSKIFNTLPLHQEAVECASHLIWAGVKVMLKELDNKEVIGLKSVLEEHVIHARGTGCVRMCMIRAIEEITIALERKQQEIQNNE